MKKTDKKQPSPIEIANYNYLLDKPKSEFNLLDFIALSVFEEKYPELKT